RKLVVADGCVAWSGGRNFTDEAFLVSHDLSYTLAGPLAAQMAQVFDEFWQSQGGKAGVAPGAAATPAVPNAEARLIHTTPTEREFAHILYDAVGQARRNVYVENPYFSDNHLVYLLAKARMRGADVRAVITIESDSQIYNRSNRVMANRLLA